MKISESEIPATARRFKPAIFKMVRLGIAVCSIYGGGILSAVWAGKITVEVAHSGGEIPILPWSLAFFFVISGMLAVIYAFFFRPREVRLTDQIVALLWWDGNGKVMHRSKIEQVDIFGSKIVLRGAGESLTIPPIFFDGDKLGNELKTWKPN